MNEHVISAWQRLPETLSQHVVLSAAALLLGIGLSLPLAAWAIRSTRVRWWVLTVANLIQTIPSLALLALFYPLLIALSQLSQSMVGQGFSALGFLPSLLALTLYSMLPILRNSVVGVTQIDANVIEAARGVGMTDRQRLFRVELPLALPVIMAGVRTAAVWVIGAATLSTPVGQTSLGNYIFSGLQVQDWVSVLFGCVAAALLALAVDQLLGLIESGVSRRQRWRVAVGVLVLLGGVVAAQATRGPERQDAYIVGAKNFSEQYILAELIGERIRSLARPVTQRADLGSTVAFRSLVNNDIDVYVDYSGTIWANIMKRTETLPRATVLSEMRQWLEQQHGVELLGSLGFENAYALAMRRDRAEALGIRTIADLAAQARQLRIGADLEFLSRPEWIALRDRYGLGFAAQREFQPTFMYKALVSGDVDVISAFSSDGRIAANDLIVLQDPKQVILPYDAIVLIAPRRTHDPLLHKALQPLVEAIPIERMREANLSVDRDTDKQTPQQAARWLQERLRGATH